jgi:hypothetical protein
MKLYTEEQVKTMLIKTDKFTPLHIDYLMDEITPIELPSNKEIEKKSFQVPYDNTKNFYDLQFIKGAKWMRDKIQGGNK